MIFKNLDEIDWKAAGFHVCMGSEKIPQKVRELLSPEKDIRNDACGFLLGDQQDFGDIYDTTPMIIPFCLEVLRLEGAPGKAELLFHLAGTAEYIHRSEHLSVHMINLCLQTYLALQVGLDTYLALLADPDKGVRLASAELLQYLTDDVERLIPALLEHFNATSDQDPGEADDTSIEMADGYVPYNDLKAVDFRVILLRDLKVLLASLEWPRFGLKKQYAPALEAIAGGHPEQRVRVAAARALVETLNPYNYGRKMDFPAEAAALIAREFLQPDHPMDLLEQSALDYYQENIVRDLARLDSGFLLSLLSDPRVTAQQANLLVRGLLWNAFLHSKYHDRHWKEMPCYDLKKQGDFFVKEHAVHHYLELGQPARSILQAIVDTDRAWERSTNLFSYFYGLPDSREALRALLAEM